MVAELDDARSQRMASLSRLRDLGQRMKKYLVRAGFDPFYTYSADEILSQDRFAGNSGNMVYAFGVMNALKRQDTIIDTTFYKMQWSKQEIQFINNEYDAFIIPFADAFRKDFVPVLEMYTKLIKQLSIPCVLIGVGLRAKYEPQLGEKRSFDPVVYEFVKTILDHSAAIGLRGEITAKYLTNLGFKEERDYTVIGCPSLYTHGDAINYKGFTGKVDKYCTTTNRLYGSETSTDFLKKCFSAFENRYLIQQRYVEFQDLYCKESGQKIQDLYIFNEAEIWQLKHENRIKYFSSFISWEEFLSDADLFIGNRFHGTVMALLSGVPSILLPIDSRTRELAEYHRIPCLSEEQLKKENRNISELLGQIDFGVFHKRHDDTLEHYVDFLQWNGLESVFDDSLNWPIGTSPMEREILRNYSNENIRCYESRSSAEKMKASIADVRKHAEGKMRGVLNGYRG